MHITRSFQGANVSEMTLFNVYSFEDADFNSLKIEPRLVKYNVVLHKNGAKLGELTLGSVVTHLGIDDWCTLHGYQLIELFGGGYVPSPKERTDLF